MYFQLTPREKLAARKQALEYGIDIANAPDIESAFQDYITLSTAATPPPPAAATATPTPTPAATATPTPTPTPASDDDAATDAAAAATIKALKDLLATNAPHTQLDEQRVKELIKENQTITRLYSIDKKPKVTIDRAHKLLPKLVRQLQRSKVTNVHPYLVGGAGTGKTTAAIQAGEVLGLPVYVQGACFDVFPLIGFINIKDAYQVTDLFRAYTEGGVMVLDEMDAYAPDVITAINALIANSQFTFPHGTFKRHPDFYLIGCGNTDGLGATDTYTTRQQLDGAALSRFTKLDFPLDVDLENTLVHDTAAAFDNYDAATVDVWLNTVRNARQYIKNNSLTIVACTRHAIAGAAALSDGDTMPEVINQTFFSQFSDDQRRAMGV